MIKTKIFMQGFGKPCIDEQINRWIAKHPDYIIVDIKLQSSVIDDVDQYWVCRDALVIYREYEKPKAVER